MRLQLHSSARRVLAGLALVLVAASVPRCAPFAQEARGAETWTPFGGALAVANDAPMPPAAETPPPGAPLAVPVAAPRIAAPSALVADLDTGEILFAKHPDDRRPIASLTKIMTAMVVLERTQPTDVVTVSKLAARQVPTKLGLRAGQRMNVHDLLYALMLHSSNDVAVAFAEHVSDSVRSFDSLMTSRARAVGLTDTRFASPSGLNDHGYSTARDVATMTRWAYTSPIFAKVVAAKRYKLTMPGGASVVLRNLNDLLFDYPGAIGVKTGYTSTSHWSLVGVATRGSTRLMVVLLGDPAKPFTDGKKLLNWGFGVAAPTSPAADPVNQPAGQPAEDGWGPRRAA